MIKFMKPDDDEYAEITLMHAAVDKTIIGCQRNTDGQMTVILKWVRLMYVHSWLSHYNTKCPSM